MSVISSFLSRLSKREKVVVYIAASIFSITLIDRIIFSPLISRTKDLDKRIDAQERLIKKNTHIINQKRVIDKENEIYSTYSVRAASEEEEIASLLKTIENFASESEAQIIDIKPRKTTSEGEMTKKYIVDLNCEAPIEKIITFMRRVDSSNLLLRIERFNVIPKSKGSSLLRFNISISKTVVLAVPS